MMKASIILLAATFICGIFARVPEKKPVVSPYDQISTVKNVGEWYTHSFDNNERQSFVINSQSKVDLKFVDAFVKGDLVEIYDNGQQIFNFSNVDIPQSVTLESGKHNIEIKVKVGTSGDPAIVMSRVDPIDSVIKRKNLGPRKK